MRVLYIEWLDASTNPGWKEKDTEGLVLIRSVGFELQRNKECVVISTSISSSGKYLDQLNIPVTCIIKQKEISKHGKKS